MKAEIPIKKNYTFDEIWNEISKSIPQEVKDGSEWEEFCGRMERRVVEGIPLKYSLSVGKDGGVKFIAVYDRAHGEWKRWGLVGLHYENFLPIEWEGFYKFIIDQLTFS